MLGLIQPFLQVRRSARSAERGFVSLFNTPLLLRHQGACLVAGLPARTASHSLSVNPEELKLNHQFRRHENAASRPALYFCTIHDEQYGA